MKWPYLLPVLLALFVASCAESPTRSGDGGHAANKYRIQKGDTLYSIAFRYGTDYRQLAQMNGIQPPYLIYAGQEITVPGKDKEPSGSGEHLAPVLVKGQPMEEGGASTQAAAEPSGGEEGPKVTAVALSKPEPLSDMATAPRSQSEPAPVSVESAKQSKLEVPETSASSVKSNIAWSWPASGKVIQTFSPGNDKKGIDIAGTEGQAVLAAASGDVVYSGSGLMGYGNLVIIKHDESHLSAYGHNKIVLVKQGDKVKPGQKIGEMGQTPKDGSILHFEIRRDGKPVDPLRYLPKQSPS